MADSYRKRGQFDEAIRLCLEELKVRPAYISARVVLGRTYLDRGDDAKAEEEFHRVIEVSPENLRARVHLAEICEAQGRTNDAIRHYEAALELVPLNREILASLLTLRRSVHPPEPSLSRGETRDVPEPPVLASIQTAGDLFATETLADLYASQGLTDRAAAIYQELLDNEPFREHIRAKLIALQQSRESAAVQPEAASATPAAHPSEASQLQSVTGLLPLVDVSEEPAAVACATPVRMSREQMLLDELERWLQGIRRYRMIAAARQRHGTVEAHSSLLPSTGTR
jgi:tetratricopeptide (TPR) repeat protein